MTRNAFAFFRRHKAYGVVFLRFAMGIFLIYGVQDNVFSWERMLEFRDFLQAHGVPYPLVAAHLSVYTQFLIGLMLLLGWGVRIAGLLLIINFTAAIIIVHIGQTFPQYYPAAELIFAGFFYLFNGAGPLSVDSFLEKRQVQTQKQPVTVN
ncbi:DoxX family protein [Pontibacter sp. FD36]|uniref:DoxX family protein n=1 Tax=Pontibacter sp. FD36 TaxID=2789860 RepID=UPI0018A907FE|nr:DoxX family protein [Pontibacter sp. FD36]MBF8962634.1 DoxX family protein [Pontibacter sp. FD36]